MARRVVGASSGGLGKWRQVAASGDMQRLIECTLGEVLTWSGGGGGGAQRRA